MSASEFGARVRWSAMTANDLAWVLPTERLAYSHPWREQNFTDCLAAGYFAQVLWLEGEQLGYFVAMRGVEEIHLLNITVVPSLQRLGWGRFMLDRLFDWSLEQGALWLWLEVRQSNHRAIQIYQRRGFITVGRRKLYYPGTGEQREDAIVMGLPLKAVERGSVRIEP